MVPEHDPGVQHSGSHRRVTAAPGPPRPVTRDRVVLATPTEDADRRMMRGVEDDAHGGRLRKPPVRESFGDQGDETR